MKKFFTILLILYFSQLTTHADVVALNNGNVVLSETVNQKIKNVNNQNDNTGRINKKSDTLKNKAGKKDIIEDDLINLDNFPKVVPVYVKDNKPIVDELVEQRASKFDGNMIQLWARKNEHGKCVTINDELVTQSFRDRVGSVSLLKRKNKKYFIEDNLAKLTLAPGDMKKITAKNIYDFTKPQIPVQLKVIKNLTTKNNILEGDSVLFKTIKDVSLNGIKLPKGTHIVGRVETVSESDKMGCPANIIIDNFYVKDRPDICFYGNVSKTGANRSIWVYPLYQAGNIMFYVAGFVFVPIHGGHAKLLTGDTYTVFYETR